MHSTTPLLTGSYDLSLVCLSVLLAAVAAYAALDLAARLVTARADRKWLWLCCGSLAMGCGIWVMHYVGMLAYRLPIPVLYDWPTVLASLLAAVLASGIGLFIVTRPSVRPFDLTFGSVVVGGGIAAMHYIGMDAMRLRAMCQYSPALVTLSIAIAMLVSYCALRLVFSYRSIDMPLGWRSVSAAAVMGSAVAGMHYTGMAAASFRPLANFNASTAHAVSVSALALSGIVAITLMLLSVAFVTARLNLRLDLSAQQLAESQLRLEMVFENIKEGIVVLNAEGKIVMANKAGKRLLSLDLDDHDYSQVIAQFDAFTLDRQPIPPEDWPSQRALRGDFVEDFQILFRHRVTGISGAREISTALAPHGGPKDIHIIVTYRDTSQRWLVDEARQHMVSIVESSDDAIIGKDAAGIITSWNRGARRVFGYSAEEMIGQSIRLLLPPDLQHEEDEILARILKAEIVDHFETRRLTKAGNLIHVSLTISPIKDASGRVIGASKIARDITERKLLEDQLHQSQKLEAVGQLTGGIAHDFNNLLGIILGNLDLLERQLSDQPAALKRVQTAQLAAGRGADLTRRLLTFANREELRPAATDLPPCIENILELAAQALGPYIRITTNLSPGLPPILVDANRFENAILNLVVNARDAMPAGGVITVSASSPMLDHSFPAVLSGDIRSGCYARISVSDTGTGMPPEVVARAFEPFYTNKPRGKGTGLGLAMVYGFAKQSGGAAHIYSEPGFGTTVSLYLPFAGEGSQASEPEIRAQIPVSRGVKVLVVDDEEDLLEVASIFLNEAGYRPICARSAIEALEILQLQSDIRLLITDVVMGGGLNGVTLVEKARQACPDIRYFYCSGFPSDNLSEIGTSLLDAPLLQKPYQREEFQWAVQRAFQPITRTTSTA
jgi:PAS domain S-box-containing protein